MLFVKIIIYYVDSKSLELLLSFFKRSYIIF
jgi:hypothetical protein